MSRRGRVSSHRQPARNYGHSISPNLVHAFRPQGAGALLRTVSRAAAAPERDPLGDDERAFIGARDSFYLATVSEDGWPYVQHRGGAPGFLHVINPTQLAFADYKGNRQLLTTGNLAGNDRVTLFLMDYPNRTRLKIIGHARVEDAREHLDLIPTLADPTVARLVERFIFVDVVSFNWNCQQYITPRYTLEEIEALLPAGATVAHPD